MKQATVVESSLTADSALFSCLAQLPPWFQISSSSEDFRMAMIEGSEGLTDKVSRHDFQHMYHRYIREIVDRACVKGNMTIKIFEIGLGCSPKGGMIKNTPGGSAKAWRHLFPSPTFDLDLHIMEYDKVCGEKWTKENPGIATVHFGDQGSKDDLFRVVAEAGDGPFDLIIDDGPHINEYQILAMKVLTEFLGPGGVYVVEDIHSSCKSWSANLGSRLGPETGGSDGCMRTLKGGPTVFSALVEWQKELVIQREPLRDINHIDIHFEAAVLQKCIK